MVTFLWGVLGTFVGALLVNEYEAWGPELCRRLLRRAVRGLPEDRRDRYFEEWSAHLDALPTPTSKLVEAFRFSFAAFRMRLELEGARKLSSALQDGLIRAADIGVASFALISCAPWILGIAFGIRLSGPGPILWRQERVGKGGRMFYVYKFRTMHLDAADRLRVLLENDSHARRSWVHDRRLKRDPRLTLVGAFLRRTSLDELPQLVNVLGGSMSMVGPRPIGARQMELFADDQSTITSVKPGLTGVSLTENGQISLSNHPEAWRTFNEKRSIRLYVTLLVRTFKAVWFEKISD